MNVINVIGDYTLIFIFHWGAAGAAAASLVSRMIACFILLYRLSNKSLDIHIGVSRRINIPMIRRILHIGIPNGVENSIFQLGRVLVVGIIAMFGTSQIAANAIANNLDSLGVLPGQAMSLAIITVIGPVCGCGRFQPGRVLCEEDDEDRLSDQWPVLPGGDSYPAPYPEPVWGYG